MADGSTQFHEDPLVLSVATKDRHRAVVSLMEELEAIDWYDQRAEATEDLDLAALLRHNRDEEVEHAAMLLEWLRRQDGEIDRQLRRYLFTETSILQTEQQSEAAGPATGSLGLGSLAGKERF